ncbi:hypothetical protein BS78_05G065800 [Paspalum vaginatum]|nr:hypothetical protein BS78_05G065800 [Paspalum vaginatum]
MENLNEATTEKDQNKPKEEGGKERPKDREEKKEAEVLQEEIEMRVYMHCKGCTRKVKKILTCFDGVEDVIADCKTHKVVVKGKKAAANPMKVVEHVQKKTGHKVELLVPIPSTLEEKPELPRPEEKEPPVTTVVLEVYMHCETCAWWIKKRILKMKGVQSVEPDLKTSEVIVKGMFEEAKLARHVYRCIGEHTAIIKSKKVNLSEIVNGGNKAKEENEEGGEEKKDGMDVGMKKEDGNGDFSSKEKEMTAITMENLGMHYPWFTFPSGYYLPLPLSPPGYVYQPAYPPSSYAAYTPHHLMTPQIFSDDNPNTCSMM